MLVDYPIQKSLEDYQKAIDEMVQLLAQYDGVHTVFQVGGLSSPGISDIDFFVVFKDGATCTRQPLSEVSPEARYLFTHSLFGTSEQYAAQTEQYTFFGNYRKLWGEGFDMKAEAADPTDALVMQVALEYLAKMYITMNLEATYKVVGVRNFLLLGKAIMYDLDLLQIKEGPLHALCKEVLHLRDKWFQNQPSNKELKELINSFSVQVEAFIESLLKSHTLYLPQYFKGSIARNINIQQGATGFHRKGVLPFPSLGTQLLGSKYKKVLNRMNQFHFSLPYAVDNAPAEVANRFTLLREAAAYNREHLPHFSVTGYPLNIF